MPLRKKIAVLVLPLIAAVTPVASGQSVLSLDRTLDDKNIVPPESFETDVRALQNNWYLRNYAVLDSMVDRRDNVAATDEEITERLKRMPTVIETPYNKVVRAYIDMYTEKKRSLVETMLGMSSYYMPIFEAALEKEQMPLELKYLPVIESAINPVAVSRVGATGLWQFMPASAKGLGLEINSLVDERRDPVRSSEMAAKYLKQLYEIYGDWSLAIAAYNCGPGNVNKALRRAGEGKKDFWEIYPFLPTETRGYVPAFIAACYVMNYYGSHNITPAITRRPIVTDSIHVSNRVHFNQIAAVLDIPVDEIRILNPQYRADVIPGDVRPYPLVLPSHLTLGYIVSEDSILSYQKDRYNHRANVEPSDGTSVSITSDGDYIITEKTQYHKVARGETINTIARKYGVTAAQIKRTNGIKKVRRGQTIRIVTTEKTLRPVEQSEAIEVNTLDVDSLGSPAEVRNVEIEAKEGTVVEQQPAEEVQAPVSPKKSNNRYGNAANKSNKQQQAAPKSVTVRSGDNLSKIAKRNGTTVAKLKKLNNLTNDNIRAGQRLRVK